MICRWCRSLTSTPDPGKRWGIDMDSYKVISSDSHVVEPPDLWTGRVEAKFRDRAPRVIRNEKGGDWWHFDGLTGAQCRGRNPGGQPLQRARDDEYRAKLRRCASRGLRPRGAREGHGYRRSGHGDTLSYRRHLYVPFTAQRVPERHVPGLQRLVGRVLQALPTQAQRGGPTQPRRHRGRAWKSWSAVRGWAWWAR